MQTSLSIGKAAQLIGVSLSTMYRWIKSGKIKENFRTFGNHRRFLLKDIQYLIKTKEYGISVHQAAAYVLARRHYKLQEYYHAQKINFIFKDKACSLTIPEDIFKKQDKIKPTKFHSLLYYWLAKELKAPSRFYQRGTLTSQVVQPTSSHEILEING